MPEHPNPKLRDPLPSPGRVAPAPQAYAELDVMSNFSFLRGASHPDELVNRAAELGYRAMAITDVNSLAGVVRAHEAAKETGLKLLIGARLCLTDAPDLLVWMPDRAAYGRLCRLLTLGKRRAVKGQCQLSLEDFLEHQEGMLAAVDFGEEARGADQETGRGGVTSVTPYRGTPCINGVTKVTPPRGIVRRGVSDVLKVLSHILGDRLSIAASCLYGTDDQQHMGELMALSQASSVPLLATNHVHYHDPRRRALQDVLTCIRHSCTLADVGFRLLPNGERYLKSPAQMHRLFAVCPQAIRRGLEIAGRCEFKLDELRYEYPDELAPAGLTPLQFLSELTWAGAVQRYPAGIPDKVRQLLNHELALIEQLHFEAYFLTVYDLVRFARSRGILCQGRGSAANSAVCYCIGVTSVDPSRIDLLFERFISAARGEPPDIDIDFEHERREEVLQYIYEKYGRQRSGMTAEVITYRGRSAVRDVGKAMGLSLDRVDQMAKRLDWWHRGTLTAEQLAEIGLDASDPTISTVIALTGELLGFPRHLSQHVGGMIMTRGPLCELVPIENASMDDRTVIEWDKDDIDTLGILKVDCLGLGMLTCVSKALAMIDGIGKAEGRHPDPPPEYQGRGKQIPLELHTIPPEDAAVYDMICDADTVGVFQIESRAQMTMLPRLRPRCFYDLVIEVAIVRPGPIQGNMVHPYLRRRNGEEPVVYPSQALRQVLQKTLGVPLFQEQAMRVAMVAAGFSAEEADRLRRAMAAWRRSGTLETFHEKIVGGMLGNGYTAEFAEQCWLQIRGFGEYGFPESHAASFALLVYVSAWLKRYHPAAFAAALLNSQPMGFYAPAQIIRDAREYGVEMRPIDVNFSHWDAVLETTACTIRGNASVNKKNWGLSGPAVRVGFRQIKGLQIAHAQQIVDIRQRFDESGRFTSVAQFHRLSDLPRHAVARLAQADAFGSLGLSRREALWQALALHDQKDPLLEARDSTAVALPIMPLSQEVMHDYRTAGHSLKRHPLSFLRSELSRRNIITAEQLQKLPHGRWVKVAGLVLIRQRPGTASGIVFETLEDESGVVNLIIRPDLYERQRSAARHAALLEADGYVERQGQVLHVMAKRLCDLSDLLSGYEVASRDFH